MVARLEDYKPKKEKIKTHKKLVLPNAIGFYKERKMILIAFENGALPLAKLYPSGNAGDWKEDEIDSTHIIPEKIDQLLSSVKRKRKKTEKGKSA